MHFSVLNKRKLHTYFSHVRKMALSKGAWIGIAAVILVIIIVVAVILGTSSSSDSGTTGTTGTTGTSGGVSNPPASSSPAPVPTTSTIQLNLVPDDNIVITRNGVNLATGGYSVVCSTPSTIVKAGDIITIQVTNTGGPAGYIGTMIYDGVLYKTGATNWPFTMTTSGAPAAGVVPSSQWAPTVDMATMMALGAQWLWTPSNPTYMTTPLTWSWTVPAPTAAPPVPSTKQLSFNLSVDDTLSLAVNGKTLGTIPGWGQGLTKDATLNIGDVVTISANNGGGPGGVIGTISSGGTVLYKTGGSWPFGNPVNVPSGQSIGVVPASQWGTATTAPAAVIPLMNAGAQWLWTNPSQQWAGTIAWSWTVS
jgi:hypothetical protein